MQDAPMEGIALLKSLKRLVIGVTAIVVIAIGGAAAAGAATNKTTAERAAASIAETEERNGQR